MANINELDLLTLIVGVSVYVGTIRLVVIGRLISDPKPDEQARKSYKTFLRTLVPADVSLVIAAAMLFLRIFWADLWGGVAPQILTFSIPWLLSIAVLVLVIHHVVASFSSLFGRWK